MLNDKEAMTYTELMGAADVISTGTLNYHIKVLGDLLVKNESGQYTLSNKGKAAVRLITEFPDVDYSVEDKKIWWRRFWIVAISINIVGAVFVLVLYTLSYIDKLAIIRVVFASAMGFLFLYVFYRMVRSNTKKESSTQPQIQIQPCHNRTVADVYLSGRSLSEVSAKIQEWIKLEGITVEAQHENYIRGRLGIPSGLGFTAPKYFEILCSAKDGGVNAHTEGWISVYDIREMNFTNDPFSMGNIPRRKGQKVIEHLWTMLKEFSR
jgi:hypothetical protein